MTTNLLTLTAEDLEHLTGYKRQGDLEKWLRNNGVVFFRGQGGRVWTTMEAVNRALGLTGTGEQPQPTTEPDWSSLR